MAWTSDSRKIGFGLTAFGMLFTMLGVLFFFDQALLAMGNVSEIQSHSSMFLPATNTRRCPPSTPARRLLPPPSRPPLSPSEPSADEGTSLCAQLMFLVGITLTIGTSHVMSFFLARKKLRVCYHPHPLPRRRLRCCAAGVATLPALSHCCGGGGGGWMCARLIVPSAAITARRRVRARFSRAWPW
jgi:hypothetical protein